MGHEHKQKGTGTGRQMQHRPGEKTELKNGEQGHLWKLKLVRTTVALRPAWDLGKRGSHARTQAEEPGPRQRSTIFSAV